MDIIPHPDPIDSADQIENARPGRRRRQPTGVELAIGQRLREIRCLRGMSQIDLARKLGVSNQQLLKYELGRNRISAATLVHAAEILNVPPSEIIQNRDSDLGVADDIPLRHRRLLIECYCQLPTDDLKTAFRKLLVVFRNTSGAA